MALLGSADFAKVIRAKLRSEGKTIAGFAGELKVSEPTLKRWLNGKGLLLEDWIRMLSLLGLNLADVAGSVTEAARGQFLYSEKQEKAFVREPSLLAFFQALLEGKSAEQILVIHGLTQKSVARYLKALDGLELIRWKEGLKFELLKKGEPKWRPNGELSKAFRSKVFSEFVVAQKEKTKISLFSLSKRDKAELAEKIETVFEFARSAERRARVNQSSADSVGLAVVFENYKPEFLSKITK